MAKFQIKYLYPLLLAAFPVLALFVNNYGEVGWSVVPRPLLISVGMAGLILLFLRVVVKNWAKAALMTAWFMILFFSYGHIRELLLDHFDVLGRHRYIGLISAGLLGVGWLIVWRLKVPAFVNTFLSMVSVMAIGIILIEIVWNAGTEAKTLAIVSRSEQSLKLTLPENPPDIYYIILDMYGREDVLKSEFHYDNHDFINLLIEKGFYVASCSRTNYSNTAFSLASSLNFDYLSENEINAIAPDGSGEWDPAGRNGGNQFAGILIRKSALRSNLEKLGYQVVSIKTEWEWLNIKDADLYIDPIYSYFMTNFELQLFRSTYLLVAFDGYYKLWGEPAQTIFTNGYRAEADRIIRFLNVIGQIPQTKSPKFVFIHIPVPHPPYYFAVDGSDPISDPNLFPEDLSTITKEYYYKGYVNQVAFISEKIIPIVDQILNNSIEKPIIIIQGDHGPYGDASIKTPILNAYYLPKGYDDLYSSISPVNSFRVIINDYFGANIELMPDRSYFLDNFSTPLQFIETNEAWQGCK